MPEAAVDAVGLLRPIASATEVKVSRVDGTDSAIIDDPEQVRRLLDAIGLSQKPGDDCPPGLPTFTLSFKDRFGTRLGSLGVHANAAGGLAPQASLRDALGDACQSVTLAEDSALRALLEGALPLSKGDD